MNAVADALVLVHDLCRRRMLRRLALHRPDASESFCASCQERLNAVLLDPTVISDRT